MPLSFDELVKCVRLSETHVATGAPWCPAQPVQMKADPLFLRC